MTIARRDVGANRIPAAGDTARDPWPGVTELPSLTSLTLEPTSTAILNAAALPNALGLTELRFTSRLDSPAADTLQRASSMFSPRLKVWDARLDP